MDYGKGKYFLYLFINEDDDDLLRKYNNINCNCLETNDLEIIKSILFNLDTLNKSGGDIATINSYLILKKDKKTVYCSGVLFGSEEIFGLQNSYCGACDLKHPIKLNILKKFHDYSDKILEI